MLNQTLADVLLDGLAGELSYMTLDEQAAALDRAGRLLACPKNQLADAANFMAIAIRKDPTSD